MHAADPTQQGVFARGSRGATRPLRRVAPLPPLQAPELLDQVRERITASAWSTPFSSNCSDSGDAPCRTTRAAAPPAGRRR